METHPTSPFLATSGESETILFLVSLFHTLPPGASGLDSDIKVMFAMELQTSGAYFVSPADVDSLVKSVAADNERDQTGNLTSPMSLMLFAFFFSLFQRICTNVKDRKIEQKRAHDHEGSDAVDSSVIWLIIRQLRERQRNALNGNESSAKNI